MSSAHRARPDDQGTVPRRCDGRVAERVGDARERLVQRTRVLADGCGDVVEVARRNDDMAREAAVLVGPDRAALGAEVAPSGATGITRVAREVVGLECDPPPDVRLGAGPAPDDHAADLMAHDDRRSARELVILDVQVGAADAGRLDRDEDLAGAGHGRGHLADVDMAAPGGELHEAAHRAGRCAGSEVSDRAARRDRRS